MGECLLRAKDPRCAARIQLKARIDERKRTLAHGAAAVVHADFIYSEQDTVACTCEAGRTSDFMSNLFTEANRLPGGHDDNWDEDHSCCKFYSLSRSQTVDFAQTL